MAVRLLTQSEVTRLLPMAECLEVMDRALRTLARGNALLPLRTVLRIPDGRGAFGVMPAHLGAPEAMGLKAITVFPGNEGSRLDSHQGVVMLFDTGNGAPIAIMDASSITAIRTAAVSGVATRALARPDASDLALLGSGVQARTHLEAMAAVRPLRRVRIWSRTPAHASAFAGWAGSRFGPPVETTGSAREAVAGADIICTTTAAREPVLEASWIADGAHINAVGASQPAARELDGATVARSRLYVDRRESALNEAGDYLMALREGAIGPDHIAGEIGEVLEGVVQGRGSPAELTLFKSLGLAIEDIASAHHVLAKAEREQVGAVIELGGQRP